MPNYTWGLDAYLTEQGWIKPEQNCISKYKSNITSLWNTNSTVLVTAALEGKSLNFKNILVWVINGQFNNFLIGFIVTFFIHCCMSEKKRFSLDISHSKHGEDLLRERTSCCVFKVKDTRPTKHFPLNTLRQSRNSVQECLVSFTQSFSLSLAASW